MPLRKFGLASCHPVYKALSLMGPKGLVNGQPGGEERVGLCLDWPKAMGVACWLLWKWRYLDVFNKERLPIEDRVRIIQDS